MILELTVQTIREIKLKAMSTLKIIKDRLTDKRSKILPVMSWQLTNRTMSDISRHSRHSICLAPVRESRFRIPWNFCLWNPVPGEVLLEEPRIQLKESGILLRIRIRNPRCRIQNPRLSWISLHGAICQSFFSPREFIIWFKSIQAKQVDLETTWLVNTHLHIPEWCWHIMIQTQSNSLQRKEPHWPSILIRLSPENSA